MDENDAAPGTATSAASGRLVIMLLAIAAIGVVAYFALGMPGMEHAGTAGGGTPATTSTEMAVSPDEFARRMTAAEAFVVNVHVPDEGSIAGTDVAIPYDRIVGDSRLPSNPATPIVLYCRTGRMSQEAANALVGAGYRDVVHLGGGMDAWVDAGRPLS